jgi:hypothetical protein
VVHANFVNEKLDPVAAQRLGAIRATLVDSTEEFVRRARHDLASNLKEAAETRKKLLQLRVDKIVKPITERLMEGASPQGTYHWTAVPEFDQHLSLIATPRLSQGLLAHHLSEIAEEMQPLLDKIYEGSGIKVRMYQNQTAIVDGKEVFVYLKHDIDSTEFLKRNGIKSTSEAQSNTVKSIKKPMPKRKRKETTDANDNDGVD